MLKGTFLDLTVGALLLWTAEAAARLPYNPSYISSPASENQTEVYILSTNPASSTGFQLRSLNISTFFDISKPSISATLGDVPFATDDGAQAFVPTTDAEGILTVHAGDCRTNTSTVWRLLPDDEEPDRSPKWQKSSVKFRGDVPGPAYLSSAVPYSSAGGTSRPDLYVFGGMCPSTDKNGEDWVHAADYSQTMVSLSADTSSSSPSYQAEVVKPRSSPVAEAGFAMTPLIPAYLNTSSGKPLQHQSFVLTGGHTQQAFINMSQVALFSLPEATWSFIPVNQDEAIASGLDLGNIDGVEPRSGHTAVLTPDGTKIIVFGGWVGDINTPAQPQLAILQVGEEYGGEGDWKWKVPQQGQNGPKPGTGIFGHGAAMLPGGLMFVTGGYQVSGSAQKRSLNDLTANTQGYLFNTSSGNWVTSYSPVSRMEAASRATRGPLSSTSQKAGLGAGLGIGFLIVSVVAFLVYRICSRRSREHRRMREQELRRLALGAERPHFDLAGNIHEPMSHEKAAKLNLHPNPYSWVGDEKDRRNISEDTGAFTAERTGLLVEVPSPTRGLRRSVHSRNYQSSAYFEESRRHVGFSAIHPIYEGDEYEESTEDGTLVAGKGETQRQSRTSVISNPFSDSARYSDSHNTSSGKRRTSEFNERSATHEWMDNLDNNGDPGNRSESPDKSDRTLSDLSEASGSYLSTTSQNTNPLSLNQNLARMFSFRSQRNGVTGPDGSVLYEPVRSSSPEGYSEGKLHSGSAYTSNEDPFNDRSTQTTRLSDGSLMPHGSPRNPTFSQLQAESGLLLGTTPLESSKRGLNLTKSKGLGWIGNVRRTFGSVKNADNIAEPFSVSPENMSASQQRSTSTSPTKSFHSLQDGRESAGSGSINAPRRAMSTSSSMLRRKQGAKDWGAKRSSADSTQLMQLARAANANGTALSSESGAGGSRSSDSPHFFEYDDDEEWDVEAAAEGRVVQVTYTVPKEKLRVVNAGAGDDSGDDESVKSLKGGEEESRGKSAEGRSQNQQAVAEKQVGQ
ncbi:hypothetical protein AJ79_09519 [Helicocarpus griseus UAMH5409]|uniref:Galactose oxidase n=1 Tax=Helicocarpus griseus UAMH5409 TaxID=1447875 RepID=A0A2B7WJB4_9EURO|nr:hypothetical protein AJ79_09519 [Helicocarpus griseus UAMH5409]